MANSKSEIYDFVIIGSGFGGSVSALRLSEKGYKVLVIEKGKWLKANDFPKSNWNLPKWLWLPSFRFFGLFKITVFRHVGVLSGVGVGGGSLVYANTLPMPKDSFYEGKSWSHLANWKEELAPHYEMALKMLGASPNPRLETGDLALQKIALEMGREDEFHPTNVAVFFGEPDKKVPDPFFDGKGPERAACNFCGGCMTGCRYDGKNTLDKNYLYLAQKLGAEILAEKEVYDVVPQGENGKEGYEIHFRDSTRFFKSKNKVKARNIVFAGGVLGTVGLLLRLKKSSLPRISDRLGSGIRTNSEALIAVTNPDRKARFSDGVAIGSILHTDENTSVEPVRYREGSGFWRFLGGPMIKGLGKNFLGRFWAIFIGWLKDPIGNLKVYFVGDWAKNTQILLFMQSIDSTLRFRKGSLGMVSEKENGPAPTAFLPDANQFATRYAKEVNGTPMVVYTESLLGIPTTAHILGGACMGANAQEGVIDARNKVFGYEGMYVCDGSMISANPGVNPSLTITALTERAMSKIPARLTKEREGVPRRENQIG
ncbi:MAG: GMC family oxidoreductase [Bacteroidia bacterium]|nr:GMC family oxidoreductase [Bacteroidia bacterium]